MIKIGVLGAGHPGKIHIKCILQIPDYELIGFYDPDIQTAESVKNEFGITPFNNIDQLIELVDVVDIVTPTISHFECAIQAIRKSKHVFIEKPVVATPEEALTLMTLANEANVQVQVGHVERFNPAFIAAKKLIQQPMFIEAHRLSQFNPRGTDVPVVLDLMIHDIDIVLSVLKCGIRKISASGVAVVSDTPDICNARLEFDNGCVANLTASRISLKNMRKTRFFQKDAYIAIDFLKKDVEVVRLKTIDKPTDDPFAMVLELGEGKKPKQLFFEKPAILELNAIKTELESFYSSIINKSTPEVTITDGYNALEVAHRILEKIQT